MNFKEYYQNNKTYIKTTNDRLKKIINIVSNLHAKNVLDVGCGSGCLIDELSKRIDAEFYGVDVYEEDIRHSWNYKSADITQGIPFENDKFDCVILGEIIEHVPNPDYLLEEANRVLIKGGSLVISTPNLVSWANRIFVLFGIQPLYTETSSEVNLGRYFKFLGQGGKVQGHLKIFTHKSLQEILERKGFKAENKYGATFFFPFPLAIVDKLFTKRISLSSNLIYLARKL